MQHYLCDLEDLSPNSAKGFQILDTPIVLVHYRGQHYAYINSCPHRSIPLEWQPDQFLDYEKQFIQCATHGAMFRIEDGLCIAGPCVDDRLDPLPLQIVDGQLWVDLTAPL